MRLKISIKFRAFGITFGNWTDTIVPPFPIPSMIPRVFYNDHGVRLETVN